MAMVLWMMSPSTRAVEVRRTLRPRTRPTMRPLITTSSAMTSPLIVAPSPMVSRCARISPSIVPSTWMSPVVLRLPVTCRSEDSTEAGGLALGDCALNSPVLLSGRALSRRFSELAGCVSAGFCAGSLILLLENIFRCLDVGHGVDGVVFHANLIMQMGASGSSGIPHITNSIPARDPLSGLDADSRQVRISCLYAESVLDLDQTAIARQPARMADHAIGRGHDRRAMGSGEIGALVHPPPSHAVARSQADALLDGHGEGRLFRGEPVE